MHDYTPNPARPWPRPRHPWIMRMSWHDLGFLHWPVSVDVLRPLIPPQLSIDTYDGRAWVGIIPFHMTHVGMRWLPRIPGTHTITELNVRTYVTDGERPGVWFLTLDADAHLASRIARATFGLNYIDADMRWSRDAWCVYYEHRRTGPSTSNAAVSGGCEFVADLWPRADSFLTQPSTLEHWLTDRYRLYAGGFGRRLLHAEIDHAPWRLQHCDVRIATNSMTRPLGFDLPEHPPHAMFSQRCDAVVWPPAAVRRSRCERSARGEYAGPSPA